MFKNSSRPPCPLFALFFSVGLSVWALTPADGAQAKPHELAKAPPLPMDAAVKVKRGESVVIALGIHGTRSQTLEFRVRRLPEGGKLSGLSRLGQESGSVTYTPPANPSINRDSFSYVVRSNEGVSAPATVSITILDEAPNLVAPAELEFGRVAAGEAAALDLVVANQGGGLAQGSLEVNPPWSLAEPATYQLAPGQSRVFKVSFLSASAGVFRGEVRFSSQPLRTTALSAEAVAPVGFSSAKTELLQDPAGTIRSGEIELINNTAKEQTAQLTADPRLGLPASVTLAKSSRTRLTIRTKAADVDTFTTGVTLATGGASATLQVHAAAAGPVLRFGSRSLNFGQSAPGASARLSVEIENAGGTQTTALVATTPPFHAEESSLALLPGRSKTLFVTFTNQETGTFRADLTLKSAAGQITLPLEARTLAASVSRPPQNLPASRRPEATATSAVAAPVSTQETPDNSNGVPTPVVYAQIRSVSPTTATVAWLSDGTAPSSYRAIARQMTLEKGVLTQHWVSYSDFTIHQENNYLIAELKNLEPRGTYLIRLRPTDPQDQATGTLVQAQFTTPVKPSRNLLPGKSTLLIALLVGCLGALFWQRRVLARHSGY